MDNQVQKIEIKPDYIRIYKDIIKKYPDRMGICSSFLKKKELTAIEVIKLNQLIFGNSDKEMEKDNQKHRSYSKSDILDILEYKRKMKLNNSQLANYYKMSRNTITKWEKVFFSEM